MFGKKIPKTQEAGYKAGYKLVASLGNIDLYHKILMHYGEDIKKYVKKTYRCSNDPVAFNLELCAAQRWVELAMHRADHEFYVGAGNLILAEWERQERPHYIDIEQTYSVARKSFEDKNLMTFIYKMFGEEGADYVSERIEKAKIYSVSMSVLTGLAKFLEFKGDALVPSDELLKMFHEYKDASTEETFSFEEETAIFIKQYG